MVSGRRGISKCTAAVTSNLRLSSQEPLLFLYPTWARSIASYASPTIDNDAYPLLDGTGFDGTQATHTPREPRESRRADRAQTSTVMKATSSDGGSQDKVQLAYERFKAKQLTSDDNKPHRSFDGSASEPLPRRVVSGMKIRRILGNCKQVAQKEDIEQSRRNEWFEKMRKEREAEEVSPTEVLDDLFQHTIQRTPGSVLQIQVPEGALPGLLFGVEDNIMEIKHRTRSEIDLLEEEDSSGVRTLSLSGPSVCVGTAAAIILKAIPGAISKARSHTSIPPKFSTKEPEMASDGDFKARFVLSNPERRSKQKPRRADAVPTPEVWTAESLHTYVTSLTRMAMPSHMHRLLYQPEEEHQMIVAGILDEVFDNDDCLKVMSVTTLNDGISYFMKKNQIHFVRDIYYKVQLRGMRLNTETFNIMLRGAAKVKDLDTVASLIKTMVNKGYRPDSGTWLAFLAVLDDPKIAMKVVAAMNERGLFQEAGVQAKVCDIVAPYQLQTRLNRDDPTTFPRFAEDMEKHFTKQWLTLSGANKLLKVLGSRGLISECWILIDYMAQRGIQPDDVSCNTVLDACCEYSGFKTGVDLLERLMKDYQFTEDTVTWFILSKHVWEAQYYATSRVIWRYGCLKGWISYPMRTRVANSLKKSFLDLQPSESASDGERQLWANNAGAFVVTDQSAIEEAAKVIADMPTPPSPRKAEYLAQKFAFGPVKDDTDLFMTYEAAQNPLELIKRALAVDIESAKRPVEPFTERMKWLDDHAPVVTRKKRKSAALTLRERIAQGLESPRISQKEGSTKKELASVVSNDLPKLTIHKFRTDVPYPPALLAKDRALDVKAKLRMGRQSTEEGQAVGEAGVELQPGSAKPLPKLLGKREGLLEIAATDAEYPPVMSWKERSAAQKMRLKRSASR